MRVEPSGIESVPLQESQESSCPLSGPHHMRKQRDVGSLHLGRGLSPERDHVGILILDFQPPEMRDINFYCL